jgi:hypothetical protein
LPALTNSNTFAGNQLIPTGPNELIEGSKSMKHRFWIIAFYLTVTLAACTPSGSSSTDRKQSDSQATASQQSSPAPETQAKEPALAEVPDAPTPQPMGWSQFDAYFQQLQVVYNHVLTDSVPSADAKKLLDLAKSLANDKSKEHENSTPMRQVLADQVRMFMERSEAKGDPERGLELFTQVLIGTREVVQTGPMSQIKGYPEKLESMKITVENKLLQLRFKH